MIRFLVDLTEKALDINPFNFPHINLCCQQHNMMCVYLGLSPTVFKGVYSQVKSAYSNQDCFLRSKSKDVPDTCA